MSILSHVEADAATRDDFLQAVSAARRLSSADYTDKKEDRERDEAVSASLNEPAFEAMARDEEFILTVTENGFGKRTSAYEYRIAGRGGQGIANIETSERNGNVVASFWVDHDDQIVMVSDGGQIIRCPVADIRIAGRRTQGVTLFTLAEDERMVSVTRLVDVGNDDDGSDEFEEPEEGAVTATNTDEIAKP